MLAEAWTNWELFGRESGVLEIVALRVLNYLLARAEVDDLRWLRDVQLLEPRGREN